ncbi:MAG TPA: sulfatase [Phycisphaerae bacterium]|nr:sulfatase [Phycisphaerae bacterium]
MKAQAPWDRTGPALRRRDFLRLVGGAAAAAAMPAAVLRAAGQRPPNFVFLFADDLGYADLGCYGSDKIATPNLDRMAAEGIRFNDFYTGEPVCTPTRAALMTGCYPKRVGLHRHVLFPSSKTGLNPSEITVARLLKDQGYATMCIGKWHLGHHPEFLPTRHGFDAYYGIPYSNDMPTPTPDGGKGVVLLRDEKVIEHPTDQATLTERYTAEAVKFIKANKDRPFFLYLPHTMPHLPLHVSERFKGKSKGGLYGDVVECIDWSCGEILAAIQQAGIDEQTLVIFTSDNGPHEHPAPPLRGGKGSTWEGGMRVPFIARWPGKVPAGAACAEQASVMDILPTFAGLAGARAPTDRVIDGKDIWPLVSGRPGARSPHEAFFYYSAYGDLSAVRRGQWKLHIKAPASRASAKEKEAVPLPALYDLSVDVGEQTNVAADHPDVVEQLTKTAAEFDAQLEKDARPVGRVG